MDLSEITKNILSECHKDLKKIEKELTSKEYKDNLRAIDEDMNRTAACDAARLVRQQTNRSKNIHKRLAALRDMMIDKRKELSNHPDQRRGPKSKK